MKLLGTNDLKTGEKIASPVYASSGKVILGAGVVITQTYIDRLKDLGISNVYVDDEQFDDVEIVEVVNHNTRLQAIGAYKQAHDLFHKGKPVDESAIVNVVKLIVDDIKSNYTNLVNALPSMVVDDYLTGHSINVCILSILMGNNLNYNISQLIDLGVGAFIHDIARKEGMQEDPGHVDNGFEVMRKYRGISLHSSKVIYEHHENYDGSGYPRKIEGDKISQYSRIVSAADYYDSMVFVEAGQKRLLPHEAYEALLAEASKRFDPEVIEAFRKSVALYPNGCSVSLSNGKKGVVVSQNSGTPHRPVVRVIETGKPERDIDLIANLTLFVQDVDM